MKPYFTRVLNALLVLLIGILCLWFFLKREENAAGTYYFVLTRYVSPGFHLATLIGGLGMVVVGLFLLLTRHKDVACGHDHDHDHSELNPILSLCVIFIPITLSLFATQHGFTEDELARRSDLDLNPESFQQFELPPFTLETLEEYKEKNTNGAYIMEVMELFLTAGDPTVSKVIDGVKIEVEGAIRTQPGFENDPAVKRLYRMVMQCCAADMQAIPLKIILAEPIQSKAKELSEHSWIKLEAHLKFEVNKHGIKQAVLHAHSLEAGTPPDSEIMLLGRGSVFQDKM